MQPFLTLLQVQRARKGLTLQDLAAKLELRSHSYVADILGGKKQLPISAVDDWANALDFHGEERMELYRSAIADLAPGWFRDVIVRAEQRIDVLESKVKEFEATIVSDWMTRRVAESSPKPGG